MKRISKKRALSPSRNDNSDNYNSLSECPCTISNGTNTNNGLKDALEQLPPWRAQHILYKRPQTVQSEVTTASNEETSWSERKIEDILRIQECDWWEFVDKHEGDITNDAGTRNNIDDGHSDSSSTTGERHRKRSKRKTCSEPSSKVFYNIGLHVWNESRAQWKNYKSDATATTTTLASSSCSDTSMTNATTSTRRAKSSGAGGAIPKYQRSLTSSQYREMVRGLTNVTREYQLPKPMNLADLIEVYVDAWDNIHD